MEAMRKEIDRTILFPKTAKPSSEVLGAIELTQLCRVFNVLPRAGGLLDQDAQTVVKIQMVLIAEMKLAEEEAKKAKRGISN